VTGSNTGLGKVVAEELALMGAYVIMACRSRERAEEAIEDIRSRLGHDAKIEFMELDLSSIYSVQKFAKDFRSTFLCSTSSESSSEESSAPYFGE